jgi:NAD+ kinase
MMKAGLVSRTDNSKALDLVGEIFAFLEEKGVEILLETETALALDMPKDNSYLGEIEADFMITIGGDGTILRTAMQMKNPSVPLLGINMGSRGFLTEVMPENIKPALTRVLEGDYYIEESMKLSSKCKEIEKSFPDSLNEVLISSALPSKALDIRLKVEGNHIMDIRHKAKSRRKPHYGYPS